MPRLTLALLLGALALTLPTQADALPSSGGAYSVELVDASGRTLPTYTHRGSTYVLGDVGERYAIRVRNRSAERVEIVVTVDGRDVMSGDVGDYKTQRGYIINPWQTVTIDGFRQSMQAVAAFRFTSPGDSYSARRGTPQHVGVIGVAVFRERRQVTQPVAPRPPYRSAERLGHDGPRGEAKDAPMAEAEASPAGSLSGSGGAGAPTPRRSAARNNIGTQYGETRASSIVEVSFTRARPHNPERILGVYYDDAAGLAARGIRVAPTVSGEPSPFPNRRFAPPPP